MTDFDPSAPNPGVSTSENLGDEVAEVEVEVDEREDREGGRENTTTSFTKDSTADQSLSNYDNFSDMDFSFEARRVGRRDANSAIGDYVARVAGIDTTTRRQKQEAEDAMVAAAIARQEKSSSDALAAARMDRTEFSDSSTYGADWMAAKEVDSFSDITAQDIATQARTGQIGRDKWGAFREGQKSVLGAAAGNWDNPNLRPGDYTDSLGTTRSLRQAQDAQDEIGIITSGTTPVVNAQAIEIARVEEDAVRNRARQWESNEFARKAIEADRLAEAIRIDTENNSKVIKQADAVIASSDTTTEQKVEAVAKKNAALKSAPVVSKYSAGQFYSAVKDPEGSRKAKDLEVDQSFAQLKQNINNTSVRPGLFGINFTHHDNKTIRQVQAMITAWEGTYMDQLSDMGKRNSKAINAKGFDLSKGFSGFNFIQAMANKLGWAYHATDTEKQLRALRIKWNLDEAEHGDGPNIDDLKKSCNERSGYKWDEESNTCVPISNLNTDYQDYLP